MALDRIPTFEPVEKVQIRNQGWHSQTRLAVLSRQIKALPHRPITSVCFSTARFAGMTNYHYVIVKP